MGFIDSYKHLEKLCGDMFNSDRRVSAYIDEMLGNPRGPYYVSTWEEDLKMLKHYRWVRNQIAHEPGCTEQNMCEPEDELWLEDFYSRIMNRTDPLSLYRKAIEQTKNPRTVKKSTATEKDVPEYTQSQLSRYESPARNSVGLVAGIAVVILIIAALTLFSNIM